MWMSNVGFFFFFKDPCLSFSLLNCFVLVLLSWSYRCRNTNAPGRGPWDLHSARYLHNMGQVNSFAHIPTLAHVWIIHALCWLLTLVCFSSPPPLWQENWGSFPQLHQLAGSESCRPGEVLEQILHHESEAAPHFYLSWSLVNRFGR